MTKKLLTLSLTTAILIFSGCDTSNSKIQTNIEQKDAQKIDLANKVPISKLFNSRNSTYKTLKLKELNLDDVQKQIWLAKENILIKRPIVEYKDKVIVGFNESEYEDIFK